MSLAPVRFYKMSGAGNTFVLVDAREGSKWTQFERSLKQSRPEVAQIACHNTIGVCADGMLFLMTPNSGGDYRWDFYNSDGSPAEMCGNAARCAARFAYENLEHRAKGHFIFETAAGRVDASILESGWVRVEMPKVHYHGVAKLSLGSGEEDFVIINTGVPHAVKKLENIADVELWRQRAAVVRRHNHFGSAGSNVTFYSEEGEGSIKAISFERGVENFTQACGTGAVAAALAYAKERDHHSVDVHMPGGLLRVHVEKNQPRPFMEGDALFIGEFLFSEEVFK